MPRKRDPSVFTTSVSGIPEDAWAAFKELVKKIDGESGTSGTYTVRQALEEAIFELRSYYDTAIYRDQIAWFPARKGKSFPIQISSRAREVLRNLGELTGHKQSAIIRAAIFHKGVNLIRGRYNIEDRPIWQNPDEPRTPAEKQRREEIDAFVRRMEQESSPLHDEVQLAADETLVDHLDEKTS